MYIIIASILLQFVRFRSCILDSQFAQLPHPVETSVVIVLTLPLNAMRPFPLIWAPLSTRLPSVLSPKFQTLPKIVKVVHVEQI